MLLAIVSTASVKPPLISVRADTAWKPVWVTDDVAGTHARLAAAGIRVRPVQTYEDRTGFDAIDPDGNVFRIANG